MKIDPAGPKIFDLGLSRTGSRSVYCAAKALGLTAIHGFGGCVYCEADATARLSAKNIWFEAYQNYDYCGQIAQVTTEHWQQLARELPDAKFVLPVREVNSWLESMKVHTRRSMLTKPYNRWGFNHYKSIYGEKVLSNFTWRKWGQAQEFWKNGYINHNQRVQDFFETSDRLVVVNVFETSDEALWESLGAFFGCDKDAIKLIRSEPFPHKKMPIRAYRYVNKWESPTHVGDVEAG